MDAWTLIIVTRNKLLLESDWTQCLDAPLTAEEKTAFQIYRQALRDIRQNYVNPEDVIFPELPQVSHE